MSAITAGSIRDTLSAYNTGRFGVDVRYFAQVSSTSDIARELAAQGAPEGTVVMAGEQTAGRGRMGRQWVAPPGSSLMFTTLFRPSLRPEHIYRLVIACGLAAAEGCEQMSGVQVDVKWPNDLQIGGKKLVGILPESSLIGERIDWAIVGMGINITQDFSDTDLADRATSLQQSSGTEIDPVDLLARVLARINHWNNRLSDASLLDAWRGCCVTLGRNIRADVGGKEVSGVADEIDELGALWLRSEDGHRHQLTISEAHILGS